MSLNSWEIGGVLIGYTATVKIVQHKSVDCKLSQSHYGFAVHALWLLQKRPPSCYSLFPIPYSLMFVDNTLDQNNNEVYIHSRILWFLWYTWHYLVIIVV